jgi:hypothetical protein
MKWDGWLRASQTSYPALPFGLFSPSCPLAFVWPVESVHPHQNRLTHGRLFLIVKIDCLMIRCLKSATADHSLTKWWRVKLLRGASLCPLVAAARPPPLFPPQRLTSGLICRCCSARCVQRTATHSADVAATSAMTGCLPRAISALQSAGRRRGDDEAPARTERTTRRERSNRRPLMYSNGQLVDNESPSVSTDARHCLPCEPPRATRGCGRRASGLLDGRLRSDVPNHELAVAVATTCVCACSWTAKCTGGQCRTRTPPCAGGADATRKLGTKRHQRNKCTDRPSRRRRGCGRSAGRSGRRRWSR